MTAWLLLVVAGLCALAGAVALYLAAPHQRLLTARPPRRVHLAAGALAELIALACLLTVAGPATAVFIWLTAAMLFWSVLPLATLFKAPPKGRR